ncbi:MAG: L-threonylcarbamoyladenylate synthase [Candidatus Melainabacteria bacterium]|nr:L-threonylcarbamoyladenylate synthase [Candidatus Melainabacteria bacterium]
MSRELKKALELILKEEPIIVPTDTVYGLVCKHNSKKAIEKIYKLKKRDRRKPLILLGYNWNALKKFIKNSQSLILTPKSCWPGPVTLVLPASKKVPKYLNKGYRTIGIRIPNNKSLRNLLSKCPNKVLASTSANISGKKDVTEIVQKVKLFIKAKRGEMSYKPSQIIEMKNGKIKRLR